MLDNQQSKDSKNNELDKNNLNDKLFPGDTTARNSLTRQQIEITNRRYQDDPFWSGPKGLEYGLLLGARPYQVANLYPDAGTSYFVAWFKLPKGARLILNGKYGHLRYFSYTIAAQLGNEQLGNGDFIVDEDIHPDPKSVNPYCPGNNRDATPRHYTLFIVNGTPPKDPKAIPPNTLYTGTSGDDDTLLHLAFRNYLPDVGYDGTGNVSLDARDDDYGLPRPAVEMNGDIYRGLEMYEILQVEKKAQTPGSTVKDWVDKVANVGSPPDPDRKISAPALPPQFEPFLFQRFWNTYYSADGAFILDPEERVTEYPADAVGGLANNPDTVYMTATLSLAYGRVIVIKGKMPRHQKTRHGEEHWEQDTQLRYWSASSGGTLPSGLGWATVYDEEMPLDEHGNFTIVMSWQEDRPKNARPECGVKWLDFGNGEGHYIGARNWVNVVYMRYQHMSPDWQESPLHIPQPTQENPIPQDAKTMKEYYPKAKYMSKEAFEDLGNNPDVTFDLPPYPGTES